jgi:ketosteroid isomerase-like protein
MTSESYGVRIFGTHPVDKTVVERVLTMYDGFNRRDLEAMLEFWDPKHFTWNDDPTLPDSRQHHGRLGARDILARTDETFGHFEFEVEAVAGLDQDRILVLVRTRAVTRTGGVPIENPAAHLFRLRRGRAVSGQQYISRQQALDEHGLS